MVVCDSVMKLTRAVSEVPPGYTVELVFDDTSLMTSNNTAVSISYTPVTHYHVPALMTDFYVLEMRTNAIKKVDAFWLI